MEKIILGVGLLLSFIAFGVEKPTPISDEVLALVHELRVILPKGQQSLQQLKSQRSDVISKLKELEGKVPNLKKELLTLFKGTEFEDQASTIPAAISNLRTEYETQSKDELFSQSAAGALRSQAEEVFFQSLAGSLEASKIWSAEKSSAVSNGTFFKSGIQRRLTAIRKIVADSAALPKFEKEQIQKSLNELEAELVSQGCLPGSDARAKKKDH